MGTHSGGHDLDRAGKSVLRSLASDTRRYRYDVAPNVIDIGLTLVQCHGLGLQDEENPIRKDADRDRIRVTLAAHSAGDVKDRLVAVAQLYALHMAGM